MEGDAAEKTQSVALRDRVPPVCVSCTSELLQLEGWCEHTCGGLTLRLRCPECFTRTVRIFDAREAARVDDALSQARLELVGLYEAVLRNNLTEEADLLARCLALDLIGPDDFARPGR
jgi:hypothetical protein